MLGFGTGASAAASAADAAREAARHARERAGGTPKLAIVFTSVGYSDLDDIRGAIAEVLGDVPIVGGTAGGAVFASNGEDEAREPLCAPRAVSVAVLSGPDIEVVVRNATIVNGLLELVAAGEEVRRASDAAEARGYVHYTCLVFGPGLRLDGDAFVAAVRKGVGERALLAGGFSGDDLVLDRPRVFTNDGLSASDAVIVGIFTRHAVGVAARHGLRPIGPVHTITRADATEMIQIDGRPARDVVVEDASRVRHDIPTNRDRLRAYLGTYHPIGIVDDAMEKRTSGDRIDDAHELVLRSPHEVHEDGTLRMSAAISKGTRIRVLDVRHDDLVNAAVEAATAASAVARAGIAGALVLSCGGRFLAYGDAFDRESSAIANALGAPIAGTFVYGEFARNVRDVDAFFNMTAVVVVFER